MASIGDAISEFVIAFGVDTTKLQSGMNDVMSIIKGGMGKVAMGVSAAMVFDKVSQNMKQFTAELSDLNRITKNVEMSVESFEVWKNAAREAGADADQMGRVFTGVNDAMFQAITRNRGILKKLVEQGLLPDIRDAEGQAKKTEQYVLEMADALAGMDKRTAANTLKQVAGVTDIDTVEFLQQGTKAMKEQIEQAKNIEHFTTKDVQAAKELEKAQGKMANAIKMTFLPVFRALVVPMTKFADLCTVAARHSRALAPALLALGFIIGKTLLPMLKAVAAQLAKMFLTPAGAIMAALLLLGLLLEDIYVWAKGGNSAFGEYYQAIADFCKKAGKALMDVITAIAEWCESIGNRIKEVIKGVQDGITSIAEWCEETGNTIKRIFNDVKQGITDAIDKAGQIIDDIMQGVADFLMALWSAYTSFWSGIFNGLAAIVRAYCDTISELWEAMTDLLSGNFEGAINHIKAAFNAFYQPFREAVMWIFEKLGAIANKIPGLSSILGAIGINTEGGGGSAGEAVPIGAETTNNTTNTTNVDGQVNVTVNNGTPEAIERLKANIGEYFGNLAKENNSSQSGVV